MPGYCRAGSGDGHGHMSAGRGASGGWTPPDIDACEA
jgi:hypothetical protein